MRRLFWAGEAQGECCTLSMLLLVKSRHRDLEQREMMADLWDSGGGLLQVSRDTGALPISCFPCLEAF